MKRVLIKNGIFWNDIFYFRVRLKSGEVIEGTVAARNRIQAKEKVSKEYQSKKVTITTVRKAKNCSTPSVNPYYTLSDKREAEKRIRKFKRVIKDAESEIANISKHGDEYITPSGHRDIERLRSEINNAKQNIEHLYNAVNHHGHRLFPENKNPANPHDLKAIETLLNKEAQQKKLHVFVEVEGNGIAIYDKKRMRIVSIYEQGTMTDRAFIVWLRKRLRDESARLKQGYSFDEHTDAEVKKSKRNPLAGNSSFTWERRNDHLWVLLYNGELLARLIQNNPKSYSVDVVKGDQYAFHATSLSKAKTKTVNEVRKHFKKFKDYRESQPTLEYINKHISKSVIAKHGLAVRITPVAFKPQEYRIHFKDGFTADTKIPKLRNPAKRKTMRERCEEIVRGSSSDEPSYSYYRDVENPEHKKRFTYKGFTCVWNKETQEY
jgi:hypothetical protein